jgi:hypothetical protein
MALTLGFLDEKFGGVEGYLGKQGVSDADIARIRGKLLE